MNHNTNQEKNQSTIGFDSISDEPGEHNTRPVLSAARAYVQAGISVIPCNGKVPRVGWKRYQKQLPVELELDEWFSREGCTSSLAAVCGEVSGGLEVMDFDCKLFRDGEYINVFEDFKLKLESKDPNLLGKLVIAETQNGGVHVKYRCTEIGGNQGLARCLKDDGSGWEAIIETRGEGGYVVTPPSNGYRDIQGGLLEVQQITPEERQTLFELAKTFDQAPKKEKHLPANIKSVGGEEQISDWYERVYPDVWRGLIAQNGWTLATTNGGIEHWTRPGKDVAVGYSATWSMEF